MEKLFIIVEFEIIEFGSAAVKYIAPPWVAELSNIRLWDKLINGPNIPPPWLLASLLDMIVLLIDAFALPVNLIPPPLSLVAWLLEIIELLTVIIELSWTSIPPPEIAELFCIVELFIIIDELLNIQNSLT